MPYLRLYSGETLKEQWELKAERLSIGRASDNDVVLPSPSVSKHHAVIEKQGPNYVLMDNGSSNGVFVGGDRVQSHTLSFWDEIQIYPFTLKYMAVAKLPGEQEGRSTASEQLDGEATVAMGVGDVSDLLKQQEQKSVGFLERQDSGEKKLLDKVNFTLGHSRDCDLRCGGWLSAKVAATIQRRNDGDYLIAEAKGKVRVAGQEVVDAVRLKDDEELEVLGLKLKYYFRPFDGH